MPRVEGAARRRVALGLLALVAACGAGPGFACPEEPVSIRNGRFLLAPPGAEPRLAARPAGAGEPVELPDGWMRTRPGVGGLGWYRFTVELEEDASRSRPCALYLPEVNANAVAWVNGRWIGQAGSMEEPVAHNYNRPVVFAFPSELVGPGRNVLDVAVRAYEDGAGRLGALQLGPAPELEALQSRAFTRRAGVARANTWASVLALVVVGGLWVATRFDAVYGWYLLAVATWTLASLNLWWRDIPIPHWAWERLMNGALDQVPILLLVWGHRFLGLARPRLERGLWAVSALLAATAIVTPRPLWGTMVLVTHGVALALAAGVVATFVRHRGRLHAVERGVYAMGAVVSFTFVARDFFHYLGGTPPVPPGMPFALTVALVAFGVTHVLRFQRSTRRLEELNVELEGRVREREAELSANFERLRELERAQVLAAERERLMRELHDGLGGRLVAALSLTEGGGASSAAVAPVLRDALAEMRVVIDSLDAELADLPVLLAHLRAGFDPALEAASLRLVWDVAGVPDTPGWSPDRLLDVLRIVQEAVSNALQHAGASELVVRGRSLGGEGGAQVVELRVSDDGRGIPEAAPRGRGLGNMRARAERLGADLEVETGPGGTCVCLRVAREAGVQSPSPTSPRLAAS